MYPSFVWYQMENIQYENIRSFDIETTALSVHSGGRIFSYCIGEPIFNDAGEQINCDVEVCRLDTDNNYINDQNREKLHYFFEKHDLIKLCHNYKFEYKWLLDFGIDKRDLERTHWEDSMLLSQVSRNLAPSHTLENLCNELCGYPMEIDKRVKKQADARGNFQRVDKSLMHEYQIADGERPLLLWFSMHPELCQDADMLEEYYNEIEFVKVAVEIENNGMRLSFTNAKRLKDWLEYELDKIDKECYNIIGEFVNLKSDDQIRRLLYRKLGFTIYKYTDGKQPSTDKDILMRLQNETKHPIFNLILKKRSYVDALATINSYFRFERKGVLHCDLNTNVARTTRTSSSKPNLQNVNKEEVLKNPFPVPLRKCLMTFPEYVLMPVDYSGLQMRILIHRTQEEELVNLLNENSDADIHHLTYECFAMEKIFNVKGDRVFNKGQDQAALDRDYNYNKYKPLRDAFKNVGFGVAYGSSPIKVAIILGRLLEEIVIGDANYRKRFPGITNFTQSIIDTVKEYGYLKTIFGRIIYVPRDKAFIGAPYAIQGDESGIVKRAANRIYRYLQKHKNYKIKFQLHVHDEFLFGYPRKLLKYKDEILPEISRLMVDFPEMSVPLRVSWSISASTWNAARDLEVVY